MDDTLARKQLLEMELFRALDLLIHEYEAECVYLFGSVAQGKIHSWSDLDLVVVNETEQPFMDRLVAAVRCVSPRVGTEFLVYRPTELAAMQEDGGRRALMRGLLDQGLCLYGKEVGVPRNWLRFADEDLKVAELCLNEGLCNMSCFHSHQAVEKA